jgi:hypothetical protein
LRIFYSSRLTEKEATMTGGIIHFTVMDHDLMWSNDFEGEAFLDMSKVPGIPHESNHDTRLFDELKPFELSLTHPKGLFCMSMSSSSCLNLAIPSRILEILEQRTNDKTAIEFVRRRREVENQ